MITREPTLAVGIMDRCPEVTGELLGSYIRHGSPREPLSGPFRATCRNGSIRVERPGHAPFTVRGSVTLHPVNGSTFVLRGVMIGVQFHWQRSEDQTFEGALRLTARADSTLAVVNEVLLESYLASVISSEMSATAPAALLEAHAITSRSWLVAMLERSGRPAPPAPDNKEAGEIVRWYTREDHDIFDVCADDHCQRYQGISKIISPAVHDAIRKTRGTFIVHEGHVCDARFYKACGGRTDEFHRTWEPVNVSYLRSVADSPVDHPPVASEPDAERWILSSPEAYCNTTDGSILRQVLPSFDQETTDFFRWKVRYSRPELEAILREKSGLDFGTLLDIIPVERGPSARITRCRIVGSHRQIVVGKELEIRRWLSRSHLYSSAFIVRKRTDASGIPEEFTLIGAGWGHGVGLCQIGAAVMAVKGFAAESIVKHYFHGAEIQHLY